MPSQRWARRSPTTSPAGPPTRTSCPTRSASARRATQGGIGVRSYIPTFRRSPKPGSGLAVRQIHRASARARDLTARELVEHIVVEARAVAEGVDERESHYDFFQRPSQLRRHRASLHSWPALIPLAGSR